MPFLGTHMSIAGGLDRAFSRIQQVDGEALQIFVKNQRQWLAPPLSEAAVAKFREGWQAWGGEHVAAHASYLLNLAGSDPAVEEKSLQGLVDELVRCGRLGIPYLVMHPGAHLGQGVGTGLRQLAHNLDRAFRLAPEADAVQVLLETTAGQGTSLGSSFEELAALLDASLSPDRLGVCFDTAHVFAAGYELRTPEGYAATMADFDRRIGLSRLRFFHLNDSKQPLGSRKDRHAHIGKGEIGLRCFAQLLNDPRFSRHPMILETPKGKELREDRTNLAALRKLLVSV